MRLRILAVGGTIVLALAGCASGHAHASPTTTSPTPTTVAINPDLVPPVITVAYVDAVFNVLNHLYGNATRAELSARAMTSITIEDLRAAYLDPQYAFEIGIFRSALQGALGQLRSHPGDRVFNVSNLLVANQTCIEAQVLSNYAAVDLNSAPPSTGYVELRPKQSNDDPQHRNPSPWAIYYEKTTRPSQTCVN